MVVAFRMQIVALVAEVEVVVHLIIKTIQKVRTETSAYFYDLGHLSNRIVFKITVARSNAKILKTQEHYTNPNTLTFTQDVNTYRWLDFKNKFYVNTKTEEISSRQR